MGYKYGSWKGNRQYRQEGKAKERAARRAAAIHHGVMGRTDSGRRCDRTTGRTGSARGS